MGYIRYNVYLWTPPKLTPSQEIQIGRQIVLEGREAYLQKTPYLSDEENRRIKDAKNMTTMRRIVLGVVFAAMLVAALAIAFVPMLIGIIAISIYSGGSLLHARSRYRTWVDEMIAKYAAYAAQNPETSINATAVKGSTQTQ